MGKQRRGKGHLLLLVLIIFLVPLGLGVNEEKTEGTQDILNVMEKFSNNDNYVLNTQKDIQSLSINGYVLGNGDVKVWLHNGEKSYLVYQRDGIEDTSIASKTVTVSSTKGTFVSSITTILDSLITSLEHITTTTLDGLSGSPDQTTSTTQYPKPNIIQKLKYATSEEWDPNNDGVEQFDGVIDFTVEESIFSDLDEDYMCTIWNVHSIESETSTVTCQGNSDCCALRYIEPLGDNWNDLFYLYYGKYGATENNIVSTQIMYFDFSGHLFNMTSDFLVSEQNNLTATFLPEKNLASSMIEDGTKEKVE